MSGITFKGRVGSTGRSTGPHLHVEVQDLATGAFLNPETIRTPLAGLRIGEKRIPALIQNPQGGFSFNPEAGITVTSKYGPRGGRQHKGEDWALPEGTPIFYEGAGKYIPLANQGAYGNLSTFNTADNKYQIRLGHMQSLGKAAELTRTSENPGSVNTKVAEANLFGALLNAVQPKEKTLQQQLMESAMASTFSPKKSNISTLLQYASSGPLDEIIYG